MRLIKIKLTIYIITNFQSIKIREIFGLVYEYEKHEIN